MQTIMGIFFYIPLLRVCSIGDYSTATALRAFSSPEAAILLVSYGDRVTDQKDRGLWGREWYSC